MLDSLMDHARDTVDRLRLGWDDPTPNDVERGQIAIVGLPKSGKSTLFKTLFGWAANKQTDLENDAGSFSVQDYGLCLLVDLPTDASPVDEVRLRLEIVDLVIYLLDGESPLRDTDYQWIARLRAWRTPIIVVLNKADLLGHDLPHQRADIENKLAMGVLPLCAHDVETVRTDFVSAMLRVCPTLAIPLALQIKSARREAALRIIHQTTALSLVTSVEPLPLLDIPVLIGLQLHLLRRLGTLYGDISSGQWSVIVAVAFGLLMRYAAQTALKFLPYAGWILSGVIGATGTWAVGRAVLTYYERNGTATIQRGQDAIQRRT